MTLDEILDRLTKVSPESKRAILDEAAKATIHLIWVPNPGPQTDAYYCKADELLYGGQAGGGKRLDVGTLLPSPSGFVRMGDVVPGDALFSDTGEVCNVLAVSSIEVAGDSHSVRFDDGSVIRADGEHLWNTETDKERTNKYEGRVRTTHEIATSLIVRGNRANHSVKVSGALKLPTVYLPIDPYLLGLWLGDGNARSGALCILDSDFSTILPMIGELTSLRKEKSGSLIISYASVKGLKSKLRAINLLNNKHIPEVYLRSSEEQRRELLRGLLDSDGYCSPRKGDIELALSNDRLMGDVMELVCTLGIKATISIERLSLKNPKHEDSHRIIFMANFPAFKLPYKLANQKLSNLRPTGMRRYIISVEPCQPTLMRCIKVDSPSNLYLAGRSFIPTHNTDLSLGLALTAHNKSLVLRRTNKEAEGLVERLAGILNTRDGWHSQQGVWRFKDRTVEVGGCQLEEDKQKRKGIPHDLIAWDEVSDFSESQYTFVNAWNRSVVPGQRCRIVAAGNPPTRPEGLWVMKRWAAWLDRRHPRPAKEGELRWYTTTNDEFQDEVEVDGPGPHMLPGYDKPVLARSRTFIRSRLSDNPDLAATDYDAVLDALPKELRDAYRDGKFNESLRDGAFQCIPTDWVMQAIARWTPQPPYGVPMCAIGLDIAQGGHDFTVAAPRHDGWFAPLIKVPGRETPNGAKAAGFVMSIRRDGAVIVVDLGGGYGGACYEWLKENGAGVVGYIGAGATTSRTVDKQLTFKNKRSQAYWQFREALDPGQPGGSPIMLPDDRNIIADLCSPVFVVGPRGIELETKEDVCKKLGRSPDDGDAVVMAWSTGNKLCHMQEGKWDMGRKKPPKVVMSSRMTNIHARR